MLLVFITMSLRVQFFFALIFNLACYNLISSLTAIFSGGSVITALLLSVVQDALSYHDTERIKLLRIQLVMP